MPLALLWRVAAFFMPGGQIFAIGAAIARFVGKFLYWLCADIADMFKDPWRAVVRISCGIAILLLGVHLGMDHMREQRDIWRDAHAQILEDARKADEANKHKEADALKAREDAAAAERAKLAAELKAKKVKTVPVGSGAAEPKRVRTGGAPTSAGEGGGQGLFGLPALPWGQGSAKPK